MKNIFLITLFHFYILNTAVAQDSAIVSYCKYSLSTSLSQPLFGDYELTAEWRINENIGINLGGGYYHAKPHPDGFGANYNRMNTGYGLSLRSGIRFYHYEFLHSGNKNIHQSPDYKISNPSFFQFQFLYRNDAYDKETIWIDPYYFSQPTDKTRYSIESATQNIMGIFFCYGKQYNFDRVNIEWVFGAGYKFRFSELHIYETGYARNFYTVTFDPPNYEKDNASNFALMIGLNLGLGFKSTSSYIKRGYVL